MADIKEQEGQGLVLKTKNELTIRSNTLVARRTGPSNAIISKFTKPFERGQAGPHTGC